jgi:hypothetical protein
MEALLYVSTASALPRRSTVDAILATARRVNPTLDLTGMLLWRDMTFAQLLEGPTASLDGMLNRLRADERHHDIVVLTRWPLEHRLFKEWSMASSHVDPLQPWDLMDRIERDRPDETAGWLLYMMNEAHRGMRRLGGNPGVAR